MNKLFSWKTLLKIIITIITAIFVVIIFIGFQFLTNGSLNKFLSLFK
jgi:hypothetical protein